MSNKKTHFGYSEIDATEKVSKVASVFHSVASNYDLMNDLMSFGMHHIWKKSPDWSTLATEPNACLDYL